MINVFRCMSATGIKVLFGIMPMSRSLVPTRQGQRELVVWQVLNTVPHIESSGTSQKKQSRQSKKRKTINFRFFFGTTRGQDCVYKSFPAFLTLNLSHAQPCSSPAPTALLCSISRMSHPPPFSAPLSISNVRLRQPFLMIHLNKNHTLGSWVPCCMICGMRNGCLQDAKQQEQKSYPWMVDSLLKDHNLGLWVPCCSCRIKPLDRGYPVAGCLINTSLPKHTVLISAAYWFGIACTSLSSVI